MYLHGERVDLRCAHNDYAAMLSGARERGGFVWLGLYQPSEYELNQVAQAFDLHELAVEDALSAHVRPKLDRYGDRLFLNLKTLWYVDEDDAVETGEISIFVGPEFVITVRRGRGQELASARRQLESQRDVILQGPSSVVYAVVDHIVDGHKLVIDELITDVDEVETSVFSEVRTSDSQRIYTLRRELAECRRAIVPLKDPVARFRDGAVPGIDEDIRPYFGDILDHLNACSEAVETMDLLLNNAFQAHLAQISVQQNDDMRKISAGAAMIVVPTLIAGVYGQNFDNMPELHWHLGYYFSLLAMLGSAIGLFWYFRKSGWM